ncbi:type I polyketide synthase (plasmid) [Tistrella bauzanensis]|uniref:type I polyketide synthase n=1 Tax=Tistrella TaxID=171436 RepID=UPI0031F6DE87
MPASPVSDPRPSAGTAAIIGAACRFPGADDPAAYWRRLMAGDRLAGAPDRRRESLWRAAADPVLGPRITTLTGGYLRDIAGFDPACFSISAREAAKLDPQQRLLMMVAHDALEDAGITRDALRGRAVGVFIGAGSTDYMLLGACDKPGIDAYHGLGNSHSLLANRLSYYYNLKGPSLTVDTACSSSLTALHVALGALAQDDLDLAIVGGVSLILSPDLTLAFSQANMLSPSGRCDSFGAGADGYGRAEGVGVVILAHPDRLAACGGHGRARALIRASAANQDGRSNGITAPNGLAQVQVIRRAMARAGVTPADMAYMEAHGTGTTLGDAIEFKALADVFGPDKGQGKGRDNGAAAPCHVGSAKANLGHMEAAAGMGGLIKAMLMLEHGMIPPHPVPPPFNDVVARAGGRLAITTSAVAIDRADACIGISSFGFGGSNAHVILQAAPADHDDDDTALDADGLGADGPAADGPALLMLSSHDAGLLAADMQHLAQAIEDGAAPLAAYGHALARDRDALRHRVAVAATGRGDAVRRLRVMAADAGQAGAAAPRVALVFTGQGSQHAGMGADLHARNPVFRAAFDDCAALIRRVAGFTTDDLLHGGAGGNDRLEADTHLAQLALFCHEQALARLVMAAGVVPAALIGHSLGELVAQAIAGMLTPDQAVRLVHERAAAMQETAQETVSGGAMLAVTADADTVRGHLTADAGGEPCHLAAINAARSCVISGPAVAVARVAAAMTARGIASRPLRTRHAFHSPAFAAAAARLARASRDIRPAAPAIPVISNLDGRPLAALPAGSDYWSRQMLAPVAFAPGIAGLVAGDDLDGAGIDLFIEIGPDRVLAPLIARDHGGVAAISLQQRGADGVMTLLGALGRAFEAGLGLDTTPLFAAAPPVRLPARHLACRPCWGVAVARDDPPPDTATVPPRVPDTVATPCVPDVAATPPAPDVVAMPPAREIIARQLDVMRDQLSLIETLKHRTSMQREGGRHG